MRTAIVALAVLACGLKVSIALQTLGTNDVLTWTDFLSTLRKQGGIAVYQDQSGYSFFNHPPFMLHVLDALGTLSTSTPLPFPFWLRLPSILADTGSLFVVTALVGLRPTTLHSHRTHVALMLLAVAPISIMVSGFHGNTDPVMIFFVLLSIYMLEVRRTIWLAGAAFGMALNIKVVPLILIPTLVLYLWSARSASVASGHPAPWQWAAPALRVLGYFAIAAGVVTLGSLPYLVQDPESIALHVLGYGGVYGQWGLPRVLDTLFPDGPLNNLYLVGGRVLVLTAVVPVALAIQRLRKTPPLFLKCGIIMLLFMALTPGFAIQYLIWVVPWVVVLGVWLSALYFATSGVFAFLVYTRWSLGFPWYFADGRRDSWNGPIVWFELLCWASVVVLLWLMTRRALAHG